MENPETTNIIGNEEDAPRAASSSVKENPPKPTSSDWISRVWVTANEVEEDIVCDVCMNDRKCEITGDDLVMCDKCNVAVHMNCYGHDLLQGFPTTDEWFCVRCAHTDHEDITCQLC